MAKFNIISINKMSSGSSRGLLDMTIAFDYKIQQKLMLLDITPKDDGTPGENVAVATESDDYYYAKTEYISGFKPKNSKTPLAAESDSSMLLLNETQKQIDASSLQPCHHHGTSCQYYEDGDGPTAEDMHYAIQLTPENWLSSKIDMTDVYSFNRHMARLRVVYEFEKKDVPNSKTVLIENATQNMLKPLNDLLDVCVKSMFKKNRKNPNIPGNLVFNSTSTKVNGNVDMYVEFEGYPIDFCQCNNGAFALTQPTTKQPYMLQSDAASKLDGSQAHSFKLEQKPIQTVLYKEASSYKNGASSYSDAADEIAKEYGTWDKSMELLEPKTKLTGIDYNLIIGIDQMQNSNALYENETIYSNGDIYGSMSMAKNMFNPLYSMEMPNNKFLTHCRTYCGIQNSQNKVLLKFYDNVYYSFDRSSQNSDGCTTASQSLHSGTYSSPKYPYQKVEYFEPNKMASTTKHKSNLFSIKISDSGLDSISIDGQTKQKVAEQIKRDIFNGVKALSESIAPANTQFFKVYFES